MMLTCLQKNDVFTVNDTSKGNGALTYGIGLITADEVVLGGGWSLLDLSLKNYHYYLYTGRNYWIFSPEYFNDRTLVHIVDTGCNVYGSNHIEHTNGVRPVLNLSPEVLNNGDGTMSSPFHP